MVFSKLLAVSIALSSMSFSFPLEIYPLNLEHNEQEKKIQINIDSTDFQVCTYCVCSLFQVSNASLLAAFSLNDVLQKLVLVPGFSFLWFPCP